MNKVLENQNIVEIARDYSTPENAKKIVSKMNVALIAGIAAAGKDSIIRKLLADERYARIITTIPRAPRSGEINGVNYYFINDEIVRENLINEKYFEAKVVHGRVYGTTIAELQRISQENKVALSDVDVQGVDEYHKILGNNLRAIFIIPPDFSTWQERWKNRGDMLDSDEVNRRMLSAKTELDFALKADYYHFIVNDDLARAVEIAANLIEKNADFDYEDNSARFVAKKLRDDISAELELNR